MSQALRVPLDPNAKGERSMATGNMGRQARALYDAGSTTTVPTIPLPSWCVQKYL
jgi:hypothetical protein